MSEILSGVYARSHNPISIALRNVDRWGTVSHVGTLTPEGTVIEALWGPGVVETPFDEFRARYTKVVYVDTIVPDARAGLRFARAQVGMPYDRKALLGNICRRSWQDPGAWHCAELREAILAAAGRPRFREQAWRISPNQSLMVI
jgi:uncharacterized protein YycO